MFTIHELKTWPKPYEDMATGHKRFEVRKNDRDFKAGDLLHLCEWDPETQVYSGRAIICAVMHICAGEFGLPGDMCVMQLGNGLIKDPAAYAKSKELSASLAALSDDVVALQAELAAKVSP